MKRIITAVALLSICATGFSQKVESNAVSFTYTRLPLSPLSPEVGSYTGEVVLEYADNIEKRRAEDDAAYQKEVDAWQARCDQIDKNYADAMDAYNNKSAVGQILLGNDGQPKKESYPPKPVQERRFYPALHNAGLLASKYAKLSGYKKGNTNPVNVKFKLTGTEMGSETIREKKEKVKQKQSDGTTKTIEVTKYYYSVQFKHVIGVTVTGHDGNVIYDEYLPSTEAYQEFNSPVKDSRSQLESYWRSAKHDLYERSDKKITDNNMAKAQAALDSKYGYTKIKRSTYIYTGKGKKHGYDDLARAYDSFYGVTSKIVDDQDGAKAGLETALKEWETAIQSADVENKKARINAKVASAIWLNIAEASIWMNDFGKATNALNKVNMIGQKKYVRVVSSYKSLVEDQKQRFEAKN